MSIGLGIDDRTRVIETDPETEYIGGGHYVRLHGGYESLAGHIMRVTENGGPALADLMMTDEDVAGAVLQVVEGVLAQGMQITATVELDDQDDIEDLTATEVTTAFRIEDHCKRCWNGLPDPHGFLWRMTQGAMRYRSMLGEVVKKVAEEGLDDGLYVFDRIPVKEPLSWSFNLDTYGNVRGIHANVVQKGGTFTTSEILDLKKFVILAWDPIKGHPWGEGALQRAYNAWNFKIQLYPMLWKYAQLFAIPQTHASVAEGSRPRKLVDDQGLEYGDNVAPEVWLYSSLEKMKKGGSLIVTPHGTEIKTEAPPGNGAVFELIFGMLGRAIVKGVQQVSRSTSGSKRSNGTDAAAESDLLGMPVSYGKFALSEALQRDLWRVHVEQNFGEELARKFTPTVSCGITRGEDFSRNANAVSKLYSVGMLQEAERRDALKFLSLNFGRRRKSDHSAQLSNTSKPGSRPVNVKRSDQ